MPTSIVADGFSDWKLSGLSPPHPPTKQIVKFFELGSLTATMVKHMLTAHATIRRAYVNGVSQKCQEGTMGLGKTRHHFFLDRRFD